MTKCTTGVQAQGYEVKPCTPEPHYNNVPSVKCRLGLHVPVRRSRDGQVGQSAQDCLYRSANSRWLSVALLLGQGCTMTPGPAILGPHDRTWGGTASLNRSSSVTAKSAGTMADAEVQEVHNLPFESAKLKADHSRWTPRCADGIQAMLAGRLQRHTAVLDAYLVCR